MFYIVLFPEDGYTFKDRSELKATVNGDKASKISVYANAPESRIIEKTVFIYHKDEQIIDVSSWGELKNAFDEANKDYMSPMAAENITVRLQNDLYLNAYDLPRSTRYMVRLNVLRNITLDFNGHTLYGTADLPQDENSELESFLEFKVHPNDYIKDMQTVLTFKDSAGGGGVDFDISQWKDSQLAAIHVDYVNTYWVEGYLNGKRTYIEQSTGYWVCKVIFDGGNYKMNCDTVKFSNGTKSVGDKVRYRGTVVVTNIQTEVNGGRYEAYCDGVTVKNDNFGARDLAAFGIESIYTGNSLFADPENEYYEKYKYGEDLTINDGLFISDNGYSVRHFDRFWQGDDNDVKFDYFIAPMLNGGVYVGPVNFSSKSFIYMNDGSPYLNKKDLTKMTAPNCSLVLDGKPKTASQITLGDLADEDTELFAIIGNTYCSLKDVSINGTNLGKNLRGTCNTGTNNTLTWTYEDLPQEMKDLGFQYKCKVRDKKGDEWRYVTPNVADGIGSVDYAIAAQTAGTLKPASAADYSSDKDTVLATFRCTVDDGASGTLKVGLDNLEFYSCQTWEDHTAKYRVIMASVNVTAAPVSVTGVTIDETLSVNIGQTKTPSFTVAPAEATNKTVSFTSDNPAVATVNATTGAVTGVSKGTAIITIKTADGNFTDTCTVTVSCAHTNKSTVPAKDSTCTVKGWDEYKKCDDCGQLFNTSDVEINDVPYLNLAKHTGGTATCTAKAVCSVCHQPYDDYAAHSYTAETKKAEALKTAGNCRDKAVYYYSCSVCGNVEHNDAHTFLGDKNASVHVGGTSTVNASDPDHKNQVDGYTGDTKCLGCGEIIATGTSIPAGAHTPSSTWNSDGTYHWKECTTVGCGVEIDGSKAKHSSTGANVATCQHKAVCDVCNVEYGTLAAHNPASGWTSDASGHWHACRTAGCTEKCDFATHTPDHTGHATEEYAIKCTECDYVIEAQLNHVHVFDKEVVDEQYKASDATCLKPATFYKSCACGEKGTATFEYGELADHNWTPATCTAPKTCSVCHATEGDPLGHTEGTEWKSDKDNHWHTCTVAGCGVVIESSKAAHTPDREAATETDPIKCSVCDYIITPALGMQDYIVEMPVSIAVKLTGDKKPAKETFKFEIYDLGCEDAAFEIVNDSVVVENLEFDENGVAFVGGIIKIKVTGEDQLCNLTEGFSVRMVKDSTKGWTYASEQWRIELFFENDALDLKIAVKEIVDGEISEEYANGMSFAVSYEAVSEPDPTEPDPTEPDPTEPDPTEPDPTEPDPTEPDPDSPQTGDNSKMGLWIALLFVSGFGATAIYSRKRKSSAK